MSYKGTIYPSRASPDFIPVVLVVLVFCVGLFLFVCLFVFRLSSFCVFRLILPLSLDSPFLTATSGFSNVHLQWQSKRIYYCIYIYKCEQLRLLVSVFFIITTVTLDIVLPFSIHIAEVIYNKRTKCRYQN